MDTNLHNRDFSGTNIKTPAEKMHALTIITATDDAIGLSKLSFSLTSLLQKKCNEDICFVLGQWATEPVRRSPGKFIRFPAAGKQALIARTDTLLKHLSQRRDMPPAFIHSARSCICYTIEKEITYLGHNDAVKSA